MYFVVILIVDYGASGAGGMRPSCKGFAIVGVFRSRNFSFPFCCPLASVGKAGYELSDVLGGSGLVFQFDRLGYRLYVESRVSLVGGLGLSGRMVKFTDCDGVHVLGLTRGGCGVRFPVCFLSLKSGKTLPRSGRDLKHPCLFLVGASFHTGCLFFPSVRRPVISRRCCGRVLCLLSRGGDGRSFFSRGVVSLKAVDGKGACGTGFGCAGGAPSLLVVRGVGASYKYAIPQ